MNPVFKVDRLTSRAHLPGLAACVVLLVFSGTVLCQERSSRLENPTSGDPVPKILLLRIIRAEDERRWDNELRDLFSARNGNVRARAALAAGRIGNEDAVDDLVTLLQKDDEPFVRAMAAFALGEIESPSAAKVLTATLKDAKEPALRARAVEALGKIAAALPKEQVALGRELGSAILEVLKAEAARGSAADRLTVLLGLTAALRSKPADAGPIVAEFLHNSDPRIRADAANTLARLRLKDGNDQLRKLLTTDSDPIVRANAARVLGATEDKTSFETLLDRALKDKDRRVRVSAIRALATLKDQRAAEPLLKRGETLAQGNLSVRRSEANEVLELATTFGRILQGKGNAGVLSWLHARREDFSGEAPEVEIAAVRISPEDYLAEIGTGPVGITHPYKTFPTHTQQVIALNWRAGSSLAQGLGEIAALPDSSKDKKLISDRAQEHLLKMLDYKNSGITINTLVAVHSEYAIPDVLRAYAAFKPKDLGEVLRKHLKESDVIIRATAAELSGELPPDETNTSALAAALPVALADKDLNDAALAILDSLAKQKSAKANEAIKTALDSQDHLVRRKAVALLKANGAGDFSSRIGIVQTRHTAADYERAIKLIGKRITAVVKTDKGSFTIELLPEDATLNVDNFIQLAKRKYFSGIIVHRVVPNFVIQDGDPRGDGNGGPGYQIRCEINEVPYERGAVGMALSGKDTGGSQWFVTHSPQPHLDGGYTVFGNVVSGMDVVDNIIRGDVIRSIVISESARPNQGQQH